ncbi:MAG: sigma-70 family RNA polymerase sigma factor [Verrucomicrobiae bacterium]|nr:sigma-70 family RNA polymerase sigma factor [Verrucomicrobiae bacterium]
MNSDHSAADMEWVREALRQHEGPLTRYAMSLTGNLDLARDVVQDTFLRLCEADRARVETHLAEWLFTVCRNRAFDLRRKEGRMTPFTDSMMQTQKAGDPAPSETAGREDSTRQAMEILKTLPENQREVIRLKFQNGLSYQEISRITSLSVSNVGFLLHTALKNMRKQMMQLEGEMS